jgi:hypothetical protein
VQVLHVGRQLEITRALHAILEKSFPEEYLARRQETLEEAAEDDASSLTVPLFVMQCIMPGAQSLLLNETDGQTDASKHLPIIRAFHAC